MRLIALLQFKGLWMTRMSGLLISSQLFFGCLLMRGRFQFVSSSVSYHPRLTVKQPTAGSMCCCLRLQYGLVKVVIQIRSLGLGLHYHGLRLWLHWVRSLPFKVGWRPFPLHRISSASFTMGGKAVTLRQQLALFRYVNTYTHERQILRCYLLLLTLLCILFANGNNGEDQFVNQHGIFFLLGSAQHASPPLPVLCCSRCL